MEPRPPPAAPTQTPTNRQKVPNPQSPSLTGQGPRAQASTAPARPHRGHRQPPRPQPPGRHILQGRHNRPPRAPDGTGAGVGPPPPHLPGTRPTARRPPGNHPHVYPGPESVQMLLAQGTPLYAQTGIHIHLVHHLSVPGRLGVYEVVGMDGNSTSSTPTSPSAKPRNPSSRPWPRRTAKWPCSPPQSSSTT